MRAIGISVLRHHRCGGPGGIGNTTGTSRAGLADGSILSVAMLPAVGWHSRQNSSVPCAACHRATAWPAQTTAAANRMACRQSKARQTPPTPTSALVPTPAQTPPQSCAPPVRLSHSDNPAGTRPYNKPLSLPHISLCTCHACPDQTLSEIWCASYIWHL